MTAAQLLDLWPSLRSVIGDPARPRNGKVARLPDATREAINRMLDDGLPYHVILERLGEAGKGITFQNLSNWKHLGGYQGWRTRKLRKMIIQAAMQDSAAANPDAARPDPPPDQST